LKNIAKFITSNFHNKELMVPNAIAQILSPKDITKNSEIAEESLNLFINRIVPESIVEDELLTVVKRLHNSYVYEFLNDLPVTVQPLILCESAYSHFMAAALKIHRRQMGIVLQHKDTEQSRIIICFNESNVTNEPVCPLYPTLEVPPLLHLYQEAENNALLETKLKLLCWITSDQLDYKTIENIPKPYLCAMLTLVNMAENQFITNEEADCILYCLQQYNMDPKSIDSTGHPDSIAERPFQIVFLYDNFHQFMVYSMNTVGLSDMVVYNQLDGDYFHQQYEKFIHMSGTNRAILLENVKDYRIY
jgi:hypothetical protein